MSDAVPTVDFRSARDARDVHVELARVLEFPGYYGHNWDAFWDCIRGDWPLPSRLVLEGLDHLERELPREAELLLRCLGAYNNDSSCGVCAAETSDDYDGTIYFVRVEAMPLKSTQDGALGAIVNCWLKRVSDDLAQQCAIKAIEGQGWRIVGVEEVRRVSLADYPQGDESREFFKQACVDDECLVFHTWDCAGEA